MKQFPKRYRLTIALVLLFCAATFLFTWWRTPSYDFASLPRWVSRYCLVPQDIGLCVLVTPAPSYRGPNEAAIATALQDMHADTVKYLVKLMTAPTNSPIFSEVYREAETELSPSAVEWFQELMSGSRPSRATLQLDPVDIRKAAYHAFGKIRTDGDVLLPLMRPWLSSSDAATRYVGLSVLGSIGANAEQAEPFLIRGLLDEDQNNRAMAALAIARTGLKSKRVVKALLVAGEKDSGFGRLEIIQALRSIGPEAAEALPFLVRARAAEAYDPMRFIIADAICRIEPVNREGLLGFSEALADPPYRNVAMERLAELHLRPEDLTAMLGDK